MGGGEEGGEEGGEVDSGGCADGVEGVDDD